MKPITSHSRREGHTRMRTRMLGLMMTVGLLMGALAVPAAAERPGHGQDEDHDCTVIGPSWSAWAQQGPDHTITIYVDGEGDIFFFGADGDLIDNDGNVVEEEVVFVDEFEVNISTGTWTSEVASSGHAPDPYNIEPGPGVYSRVLAAYCSGDLPL